MKVFLLTASLSLALLSPLALAQPGHGGGHGDGDRHGHDGDSDRGHRWNDGDKDRRRWAGDGDERDEDGDGERHGHHRDHDNGRHLGHYRFERGERLPVVYMQPRYEVEDYRAYRLAPPPPGYRWVRPDDGRYLLISTATGLISQILGY